MRGYALGGGCELAMTCDMIVAGEDAQFGQPEIKLGVMPGAGGTQRLTRAIGKAKAMEMILTGRKMGAREAEAHGLVTKVVPAEETVPRRSSSPAKIAAMPPVAVIAAKEAVNRALELSLEAGLEFERRELLPAVRQARTGRGHGRVRREAAADMEGPLMTGRAADVLGTHDESPERASGTRRRTSARRSTADAPVSGHRPPADAHPPGADPLRAPRPSTTGLPRPARLTRSCARRHAAARCSRSSTRSLAAEGMKNHARAAHRPGPAGLADRVRAARAAFDVMVNADHLLTWDVRAEQLREMAMANLARVVGDRAVERRDGRRAAPALVRHGRRAGTRAGSCCPRPGASIAGECGGPARVLVALPDRHLLVAGSLQPGDAEFAGQFADFVAAGRPKAPTSRSTSGCSSW